MPRVKVDYELTIGQAAQFINIQQIVFDATDTAKADLVNDQIGQPATSFKSNNPQPPSPPNPEPYWVFPDNQFVNVFVEATGQPGFSFSMKVTFTILDKTFSPVPGMPPFSPATPVLTATIGDNNRATIDTSVRWR